MLYMNIKFPHFSPGDTSSKPRNALYIPAPAFILEGSPELKTI